MNTHGYYSYWYVKIMKMTVGWLTRRAANNDDGDADDENDGKSG
jgi:hypothetical protein